jgi:hypothetical protein
MQGRVHLHTWTPERGRLIMPLPTFMRGSVWLVAASFACS